MVWFYKNKPNLLAVMLLSLSIITQVNLPLLHWPLLLPLQLPQIPPLQLPQIPRQEVHSNYWNGSGIL